VPFAPFSSPLTVSWDLTDAALWLSMEPFRLAPSMLIVSGRYEVDTTVCYAMQECIWRVASMV